MSPSAGSISPGRRLWWGKLRTFALMGPERHLWVIAFTVGSLLGWLAVRCLRMRTLAGLLGERQSTNGLCVRATPAQREKAWAIGQVMAAVGRNVPWECKCLAEALCVKWMLDRYRIPSVSFLGAHLDESDAKGMKAHAWLAVERKIVIGGRGSQAYGVTAVFLQTW